MTTAPALRSNLPTDPATGLKLPLSRSLGSQDLAKHRAVLAVELEVLAKKFDRFGWDRDRGTPAHDRLLMDWMDALQDYPLDEVQAACRQAVKDSPGKMPNEGHIVAAILDARRRHVAALPRQSTAAPREPRMSPEAAADILAQAGFAPRRVAAE